MDFHNFNFIFQKDNYTESALHKANLNCGLFLKAIPTQFKGVNPYKRKNM